MKSNYAIVTFIMIFISPFVFSQQPWCGMSVEDLHEAKRQMLENRKEMRDYVFERSAVTYVPVRFFLVADSDGSGRPSEKSALNALCNLNANFENQDIQFYLKEFKEINHGTIFDNPMSFGGSNAIANQMNQMMYNAINIFLVDAIPDPSNPDPDVSVAAFWQPPAGPGGNDWVVCARAYFSDKRVLSHEVGHFFSLLHPFNGWEPQPYDPAIHGNPVTQFWAPDGSTRVEHVNGDNCHNAGDAICDTPADYLFPSSNCTFNQTVFDKNGDQLVPMINNYMNYHFGCSDYVFTDDQKTDIQNSLFSSSRNYVRPNYTPNTAATQIPSIVFPEPNQTLDYHVDVVLEWESIPGADYYLVEFLAGESYVVETNSLNMGTELLPNKNYYWKVLSFNEGNTCSSSSLLSKFTTGEGTSTATGNRIEEVSAWSVLPNPIQKDGSLQINVEVNEAFEASISLINLTGQILEYLPDHEFGIGNSSVEFPLNGLASGLYVLTMQTEKGTLNRKVVISR